MEYCIISDNQATAIYEDNKVDVTVTEQFGDKEITYVKSLKVRDLNPVQKEEANIYVVTQPSAIGKYSTVSDIRFDIYDNKYIKVRRDEITVDLIFTDELDRLKAEAEVVAERKHAALNVTDLQVWRGASEFTLEDMIVKHDEVTSEYHEKVRILDAITTYEEFDKIIIQNNV